MKLTRTKLKRYLESGWIPKYIAGDLLPVQSRRTFAHDLKAGVYEKRKVSGYEQVKAQDVLVLLGKTGQQLLAELFPPKRLHKGECQQTVGNITTKAQSQAFERNWHRLRSHFSKLVESPYKDVGVRELRLFYQVMSLAWRARSFRLCLPSRDLQRVTRLDADYLPIARERLKDWGLLETERSGNGGWIYILLNPKTQEPFAEAGRPGRQPITLSESWIIDELASGDE